MFSVTEQQNSQTGNGSLEPFSSHQAPYDFAGPLDRFKDQDPSLVDQPLEEFEDQQMLPGILGMAQTSLTPSHHAIDPVDAHHAVDTTTLNHLESAESISSLVTQKNDSDQLDSIMMYELLVLAKIPDRGRFG